MNKLLVLFITALLVTACTWVELTEEAKAIRIVEMDAVQNCDKKGTVVVKLKDKIAGFDRDERKVKRELENLARNTVIDSDIDGDSIVPVSEIKDGKQTFDVYKCVLPRESK